MQIEGWRLYAILMLALFGGVCLLLGLFLAIWILLVFN